MSKFIKVQTQSFVEYGNSKSEMVKDWQWINMDYVTSYFPPSRRLHFADESQVVLSEEGEVSLLIALEARE